MRTRIAASVIVCASLIAVGAPLYAIAQAATAPAKNQANDLVVETGKAVLVDTTDPIQRVAIGSSDVAEATAVSPTEIMLNGKTAGETSLIVWQKGGARQFFNVQVHPSNFAASDKLDGVRRELHTELPGQSVRITAENGNVFLRGTVKDLTSSERAVQIASTAGKVVNLLYVNVPPPDPQILLKVRFASLDRTRGSQLGMNLISTGAGNSIGTVSTQQFSPAQLIDGGVSSNGKAAGSFGLSNLLNLFIFRPDINLGATIQALETKGIVQVLAEPNVLTMSGKQGTILAGGQYPYPVVQGSSGSTNAVTIQFKEFGVRLNVIPTITPRGTIRLQVAPEVSSLDTANGVSISGFTVPGLDVRRVKTEVELGQGESFALGGLMDNRETEIFEKIPFIGDVPILGKFFQSKSKAKNDTELIVIVTPEIVNPIPAGTPLPAIKYPVPFLSSASGIVMTTPEDEPAPAALTQTMPVEKLLESMKPEQPLVIDQSMTSSGMSAGTGATIMQ